MYTRGIFGACRRARSQFNEIPKLIQQKLVFVYMNGNCSNGNYVNGIIVKNLFGQELIIIKFL